MAAMSMKIPCPLGPLECKAKAMETRVNFAQDVGVQEMIFECDSLISSEALNGSSEPPVAINDLVEGIQHQMRDFCGIQVTHVRREGNRSTYILAQYAKGIDGYVTQIKENSTFIEITLIHDVMHLSSL